MATITITESIVNILEVKTPEAIIEIPDFDSGYFIPASTITTKGDIIVGTGAGTYSRVGVGAEGTIPVSRAAESSGIKFEAVAGLTGMTVQVKLFANTEPWRSGDDLDRLSCPLALNGKNLSKVYVDDITTASSSGILTIQLHNLTDGVDMLSTPLTVDEGETTSRTAATPFVVDTTHDDIATGDSIRIDIDDKGTGVTGGNLTFEFA